MTTTAAAVPVIHMTPVVAMIQEVRAAAQALTQEVQVGGIKFPPLSIAELGSTNGVTAHS